MQRYQVFIDEHSIFIGENRKSNQQFKSIFELNEPDVDDVNFVIQWMLKEKESIQHVFFNTHDAEALWKLFQEQLVLIEAAGGRVKNTQDEVLFIYRLGKWDLPKGKMEAGETPELTAVREVEEECGITKLKIIDPLPNTYHIYVQDEKMYLKRTFWFNMLYSGTESLIPQKEEAIESAVWVNQSDLSEQLANTYQSLKTIIGS